MTADQLSVKSLSGSPATGGLGNQGMFAKLKKMLEIASATKRKAPVAVVWLGAGADARPQGILCKNMCKYSDPTQNEKFLPLDRSGTTHNSLFPDAAVILGNV